MPGCHQLGQHSPPNSANGPRSIQLDQASANGPTALQLLRQPLAAESTTEPGIITTPTPLISSPAPDPISPAPAAPAGFSAQQIAALAAPLNRALVSSREQGRGQVCYLQSWVVINEANRIFGFDGWQRQTLFCHCVAQAERLIGAKGQGREQKPGWGVTYIARVRITVFAGNQGPLIREGTGAGHGIDTDQGLAHESAIKEAETDAMKRALITFGNPFGLALYDKSQRQVSGSGVSQGQVSGSGVGRRPEQVSGIAEGQGQGQVSGSGVGRSYHQGRSTHQGQAPNRPQHANPAQPANHQEPTNSPTRPPSPRARPVAAVYNGSPRSYGAGNSDGAGYGNSHGDGDCNGNGNGNGATGAAAPADNTRPQAAATAIAQPRPADTRSSATSTTAARAPLDPPTIHTLQECIRALLPPQLATFCRAFRLAFPVPDSTPTIAGLITEQRHQLWIQGYLGQPLAS
jgi:hypothetical protein